MKEDKYIKALQSDKENTKAYYNKSLSVKTEQQKFLEQLLLQEKKDFKNIADIACGGGTLSYHLNFLFPQATFTLVDYNEDGIEQAKKNLAENKNSLPEKLSFHIDSIYELKKIKDNSFDLVCCWQTLSWLDEPQKALEQLIRIAKPGAKIYLSSLFNLDHDVDLYTKVYDLTRESGQQGMAFSYNTYSKVSVEKWTSGKIKSFTILPFHPSIDFEFNGRGIGTYTITAENGRRLQISAGMLMNWGILVIEK
jgi:ubiquinone/menaquinone biosynthesis C-methylase UbiE